MNGCTHLLMLQLLLHQQITSLEWSVPGFAAAQQLLEWQQHRDRPAAAAAAQTGPTDNVRTTRNASRAQQQQQQQQQLEADGTPPNLAAHLAARMPHLSKLTLYYNTIVQVGVCNKGQKACRWMRLESWAYDVC